jgi:hypothetical protein
MITAAISTILGMVGGVIPEVVKEVRDARNAARARVSPAPADHAA